jgi:hypothetical protein
MTSCLTPPYVECFSPPITSLLPLKEKPMNEILQALEAMIRRITVEELAKIITAPTTLNSDLFAQQIDTYLNGTISMKFQECVKASCLDKEWFDDAIKAEVANNVDAIEVKTGGLVFANERAFESAVIDNSRVCNWINDVVDDRIANTEFRTEVR